MQLYLSRFGNISLTDSDNLTPFELKKLYYMLSEDREEERKAREEAIANANRRG